MSLPTEESPLVRASADCIGAANEEHAARNGSATAHEASCNMAKMCVGVGSLALPYSAREGGLLVSIFGLAMISMWNIYSVDRLIKCVNLLPTLKSLKSLNNCITTENKDPPIGASTYSKVAWHAFGSNGLHALDGLMILLSLGITIAYEDAIIKFISGTYFSTGSSILDSFCMFLIVAPLCCAPNLAFLAKFSAMGLFAIFLTFSIIFGYALDEYGVSGFTEVKVEDLWPSTINGLGNWYGAAVFSYGIAPFAYNIQESMKEPSLMVVATKNAVWSIFVAYAVLSAGLAILTLPDDHGADSNILKLLPTGLLPTIARLMLTIVTLFTAPLIVIPCSELLEGKIGHIHIGSKLSLRIMVRLVIIIFCTSVSFLIPDFVQVISFIGCFCVSLVSFILPALFYIVLVRKIKFFDKLQGSIFLENEISYESTLAVGGAGWLELTPDICMLVWGLFSTVVTTILTSKGFLN